MKPGDSNGPGRILRPGQVVKPVVTPGMVQKPCPPGKFRPMPGLPCQGQPFVPMPTGGPAAGVFGATSPGEAPASSPSSTPTPPPVVCIDADEFSECFASCSGVISG